MFDLEGCHNVFNLQQLYWTKPCHFNFSSFTLNFLKLYLKTVSLDYIPEPASSIPIKKPPAAGTSTLEVMADVHQRFGDVDSG